jgi:hypothetical protein
MDELTKVWQVWNRTKINRLECDPHKNVNANRVKLCKRTTRKLRASNFPPYTHLEIRGRNGGTGRREGALNKID